MKSVLAAFLLLPGGLAAEFLVGVGKDETTGKKGIGFDPSVIHPVQGDVVTFEFRSGVHSAVQSSFEKPCTPNGGFDSGVFTVPDDVDVDADNLPTAKWTVNATGSFWFFDRAGGECHHGGVLAVNPTAEQTAVIFKENASNDPGPSLPAPGSPSSNSNAPGPSGSNSVATPEPSTLSSANAAMRMKVEFLGLPLLAAVAYLYL